VAIALVMWTHHPETDGSIGCAWSASAWPVRRTSRHGMPAGHARRIMAWLDIMINESEWWHDRSEKRKASIAERAAVNAA
jgi:hypothetical protein